VAAVWFAQARRPTQRVSLRIGMMPRASLAAYRNKVYARKPFRKFSHSKEARAIIPHNPFQSEKNQSDPDILGYNKKILRVTP
jgi:hypothetical protein